MGSNVDVLVPDHDAEKMKEVLRRVLQEARKARGGGPFADKDATVFVDNVAKPFTSDADLEQFVAEIAKLVLGT